jgi:hypothetical protein
MGMAPRKANFVGRCTLLDESVTFIYYRMLYLIWFLFSLRNMPLFDVARTSLAKEKNRSVKLHWTGCGSKRVRSKKLSVVVFFLLDDFPASEFYVPTFRNTLLVPSTQVV